MPLDRTSFVGWALGLEPSHSAPLQVLATRTNQFQPVRQGYQEVQTLVPHQVPGASGLCDKDLVMKGQICLQTTLKSRTVA
jgi:hypothetical protein